MSRNLRVFTDCGAPDGPVNKVLAVIGKSFADAEMVNDPKLADLIIVDSVVKVAPIYDRSKQYGVMAMSHERFSPTQENIVELPIVSCVPKLLEMISKINLSDDKQEQVRSIMTEEICTAFLPEAPWVLVVDDKPENRNAAKDQLGNDHNLVVVDGFDSARDAMKERKFDYALLDLHMPVAMKGALGPSALGKFIGQDIPYGILLILEACQKGAHAAVVTDLNHHQDPFSAAFDYYSREPFVVNGKKALMLHARMLSGNVKDWAEALNRLMA